jgi:hypothetical protein
MIFVWGIGLFFPLLFFNDVCFLFKDNLSLNTRKLIQQMLFLWFPIKQKISIHYILHALNYTSNTWYGKALKTSFTCLLHLLTIMSGINQMIRQQFSICNEGTLRDIFRFEWMYDIIYV